MEIPFFRILSTAFRSTQDQQTCRTISSLYLTPSLEIMVAKEKTSASSKGDTFQADLVRTILELRFKLLVDRDLITVRQPVGFIS
jgi:hypothetical protein